MKPGEEIIQDFYEHPTEDAMERFLLHQSGEEELDAIETHILACEPCVSRMEELEGYVATTKLALQELRLEAAQKAAKAETRQSWFSPRKLSFAGAAAALVLAMTLVPRLNHGGPAAEVSLSAYRGTETALVPEGRRLHVRLNANDLADGPVTVEVVDAQGAEIWKGAAAVHQELAEVNVPQIKKSGAHFIRMYRAFGGDPEGDLLREFPVRVK